MTCRFFTVSSSKILAKPWNWQTTSRWLSTIPYLIYLQLSAISGGCFLHLQPKDMPCHVCYGYLGDQNIPWSLDPKGFIWPHSQKPYMDFVMTYCHPLHTCTIHYTKFNLSVSCILLCAFVLCHLILLDLVTLSVLHLCWRHWFNSSISKRMLFALIESYFCYIPCFG